MDSTTPEFHQYVLRLCTPEVWADLSFHEDDQLWHANAFARAKRGVYHLEGAYAGDAPAAAKMIRDARIPTMFPRELKPLTVAARSFTSSDWLFFSAGAVRHIT